MNNKVFAITSMAGVFPGANNVDEYWENILAARVAPLESLEKKWGVPRAAYFNPAPGTPYKTYSDLAFCLKPDAGANSEASPWPRQIRIGRRVLRDLFSRKGISIEPSSIALVLGTSWTDSSYFAGDSTEILGPSHGQEAIEKTKTFLASKTSEGGTHNSDQVFDPGQQLKVIAEAAQLGGPLLAVDAACASSFYGLDTALSLLQNGRAKAAVVMGLNAFLPPFLYLGFSKLGALSLHGEILPFGKNASGIIPGETVAAILIEPLEEALYAGRKILGTLAGFGLSADGGERSVFAPGPEGEKLALERAYLNPPRFDEIDYIEAHGTATVLGDQTEISVLNKFFTASLGDKNKIPMGSVKSLIGHTLAAAGIASIIKVLKIFEEKILPPHIPLEAHPSLKGSCLTLLSHPVPIPHRARPIRAAINSLGFGGSNAHLILESFTFDRAHKKPKESSPISLCEKLAIVDFASAFGEEANPEKCQHRSFPWSRFSLHEKKANLGSFFPDHFTVETKGLRTGPNLLLRSDPFQLHGLELVNRLFQRNTWIEKVSEEEGGSASKNMGVVVCNNLGGETALVLSRHYSAHFDAYRGPNNDAQAGTLDNTPDYTRDSPRRNPCASIHTGKHDKIIPTLESIASALPSMMSGYPAYHFNFRGFHQTVSGTSSAFWDCLISAPYWLRNRCNALILGGGRFLKSPLDLVSYQNEDTSIIPGIPGEGLSFFLLETSERAIQLQHKILATISAIIPGKLANTFDRACEIAGFQADGISFIEISQTDKSSIAPNSTQSLTGFLEEGTGTEALVRVLMSARGKHSVTTAAILVKNGNQILWTLFLELEPQPEVTDKEDRIFEIPLEVTYQNSSPAMQGYSDPAPHAPEHYLFWQDTSAQMLTRYFEFKAILTDVSISLDERAYQHNPLQNRPSPLERSPGNRVIDGISTTGANPEGPEGKGEQSLLYSADLLVQEDHPYFFDHPLDHVPGILILEGVLQLAEVALRPQLRICEIVIQFRNFCEKNSPIHLELTSGPLLVKVTQEGKEICSVKLSVVERISTREKIPFENPFSPEPFRIAQPHHVHKLRTENVLISELFEKPEIGRFGCHALSPLSGHFLEEGSKWEHSLLYLLEISRQFMMLFAHCVEKIPLDRAMNLISVRLTVQEPFSKDIPIQLEAEPQPAIKIGAMMIAQTRLHLLGANQLLGECVIKAQVVDKETYERQRKL